MVTNRDILVNGRVGAPNHDDSAPAPAVPSGKVLGVGTYSPITKSAIAAGSKTGHVCEAHE